MPNLTAAQRARSIQLSFTTTPEKLDALRKDIEDALVAAKLEALGELAGRQADVAQATYELGFQEGVRDSLSALEARAEVLVRQHENEGDDAKRMQVWRALLELRALRVRIEESLAPDIAQQLASPPAEVSSVASPTSPGKPQGGGASTSLDADAAREALARANPVGGDEFMAKLREKSVLERGAEIDALTTVVAHLAHLGRPLCSTLPESDQRVLDAFIEKHYAALTRKGETFEQWARRQIEKLAQCVREERILDVVNRAVRGEIETPLAYEIKRLHGRIDELAGQPATDGVSGPDWTCVECGSRDSFTTIKHDTPGEPVDYDMKCDECGSLDVRESPGEAFQAHMNECPLDEKAGEERVEELLDALEEYGDHGPRCAMHNVDITEPRVCDCGFDTARRRAPAQPARSTPEPLEFDAPVYGLLKDAATPPAREKDGEAVPLDLNSAVERFVSWSRNIFAAYYVADAWIKSHGFGDATLDQTPGLEFFDRVTAKGPVFKDLRAAMEKLSAPRSPSPLSASTQSNKAETKTVAQSVEQPIDKPVRTESRSSDAGSSPAGSVSAPSIAQQAAPSIYGNEPDLLKALHDQVQSFVGRWEDGEFYVSLPAVLSAIKSRMEHAKARAAAPSEAGVPSVEECERAFNSVNLPVESDGEDWTRAGIAAVRALCLASRGARGTEETRPRRFSEVRGSSLDFAAEQAAEQAAPSRGERREAAQVKECPVSQRVDMLAEYVAPATRDLFKNDATMQFEVALADARFNARRSSAPASVERDAALEDLFSVAETIESWHIAKEDGLAGEDEEDLHFALLTTILSKLRAMKSTPAPSSASVTPKNDGGAK